ncbi:MAG: hypothetical protein KAI50_03200 [Desulfobacterales bacterium]|nr:hypothetical protein [Desulfobacterales bacterium]
MWEDPIVNEVRRIREKLAEQCNFDVGVIFAEIRKKQVALGKRLVNREMQVQANHGVSDPYSTALHSGR